MDVEGVERDLRRAERRAEREAAAKIHPSRPPHVVELDLRTAMHVRRTLEDQGVHQLVAALTDAIRTAYPKGGGRDD